MGCQVSKDDTIEPAQKRARAGIGHTERLGSKPPKARQMSMYGGKRVKLTEQPLEEEDDPELTETGQLMPSEVVKRTTSSVRSTQVVLGRDGNTIRLDYAYLTQRGFYPDDVHKANQDDYSITPKFAGESGDMMFTVYDGHGSSGHQCAQFAKKKLPQLVAKYVRQERVRLYRKEMEESGTFSKQGFNPKLWPPLTQKEYEEACFKAHIECNDQMHENKSLRDNLSGTTAASACFHFGRLTCCNVGDSRIVLGHRVAPEGIGKRVTEDEEEKEEEKDPSEEDDAEALETDYVKAGELYAIPLTRDQTPYRLDERERIKEAGGVVMSIDQMEGDEPMHEDWGDMVLGEDIDVQGDPPRVWEEGRDYPGCAFTRSIGDSLADSLGVHAEPEMLTTQLTTNDEVLVIASDGVFEFLTNQQVIDICADSDNPLEACQKVVKASYQQWLKYEDRTDDITIIVCFTHCSTPPPQDMEGTTEELLQIAKREANERADKTSGVEVEEEAEGETEEETDD